LRGCSLNAPLPPVGAVSRVASGIRTPPPTARCGFSGRLGVGCRPTRKRIPGVRSLSAQPALRERGGCRKARIASVADHGGGGRANNDTIDLAILDFTRRCTWALTTTSIGSMSIGRAYKEPFRPCRCASAQGLRFDRRPFRAMFRATPAILSDSSHGSWQPGLR